MLELLPYNWDWKGISEIYVNLTRSLGDVHHIAWRARHPRWAVYPNLDERRYADWTAEECTSRHAHMRACVHACVRACVVISMCACMCTCSLADNGRQGSSTSRSCERCCRRGSCLQTTGQVSGWVVLKGVHAWHGRDCLEVHARAAMVADAATLQEMLMDFLPSVLRGASVQSMAQPWPSATHSSAAQTGLWWDK